MTDWGKRSLTQIGDRIEPPIGDRRAPRRRRLAVFVHGFNNDRDKALQNYRAAVAKLEQLVPDHRLADDVWGYFWPGYVEAVRRKIRRHVYPLLRREVSPVSEGNVLLTAALYSQQVPKALKAGRLLGEYLLRLRDSHGVPSEVVLLGHSLGCRVALEAVRVFQSEGAAQAARLPVICLMAAAVPTYMFGYYQRFWWTAHFPKRTWVLFSRRDSTLRRWFPLGQSLAGEGLWPQAVGLEGRPSIWSADRDVGLRHGQYWPSPGTRPPMVRLFGEVTEEELPGFAPLTWELPPPVDPPSWSVRESRLP